MGLIPFLPPNQSRSTEGTGQVKKTGCKKKNEQSLTCRNRKNIKNDKNIITLSFFQYRGVSVNQYEYCPRTILEVIHSSQKMRGSWQLASSLADFLQTQQPNQTEQLLVHNETAAANDDLLQYSSSKLLKQLPNARKMAYYKQQQSRGLVAITGCEIRKQI